jgi:hypothetical protein
MLKMNTERKHTGYWTDKYVQENSELRLAERVVLGDIITVHKSSGNYFKSNDALSKITGLGKRAVQDVLKSLKLKGYINEPKQIRSSAAMTIRRVITPNIAFAKKMYKKQLDPLNDNVFENTVQLDVIEGEVLGVSGCSTLRTENTLKNNRIQIGDNSIGSILSDEGAIANTKNVSKDNDWFDEFISEGVEVLYSPPIPTVISDDDDDEFIAYRAVQSGSNAYDIEIDKLKACMP